ncbi:FAST kinase domain-containing protein 3, mitochondrial-like [Ornithodoros turicata]|uniref:FAST kinase domain-containing protein 3, mitochondrial-like n=1 Tax=Ornithodoros turicata TaxID=34597 RepID=UPI0031395B79
MFQTLKIQRTVRWLKIVLHREIRCILRNYSNTLTANTIYSPALRQTGLKRVCSVGLLLRCMSSKEADRNVTRSTLIMQDGISIEELPVLIKRTSAEALLSDGVPAQAETEPSSASSPSDNSNSVTTVFDDCSTVKDVYTVLQHIDPKLLTPAVGVKALDKLLAMKCHPSGDTRSKRSQGENHASMVITELCNLITTSRSSEVIIDGLRALVKHSQNPAEKASCVDTFVQVILNRICDARITLPEILEATALLTSCGSQYMGTVDHFWQGITAQSADMEKKHILKLYSLLPYFKSSQKVVLRAAAQHTSRQLIDMKSEDVTYILGVLTRLSGVPQSLLQNLTKWISLNLHVVPDKDFGFLIKCLRLLRYYDPVAERVLERYIRVRGAGMDQDIVHALCDYCTTFRWRNETLLNAVSDFFVRNHKDMALLNVRVVVNAFGFLNLVPKNPMDFFGSLEWVLRERFNQFRPDHVVDILVSCLYLQRYPLNFVKRVFSPFFLDKMNETLQEHELQKCSRRLKFLDSALALECKQYYGPYLPRDHSAKSLRKDGRISRLRHTLHDDLSRVLGGDKNFRFSVVQPQLPLLEIYIIDYLIQLNKQGKPIPADATSGIDRVLAVVISLAEHYCNDGSHMTGQHATRLRLLRLLGYEVVELNYDTLQKLRPASKERLNYLNEQIFNRQS